MGAENTAGSVSPNEDRVNAQGTALDVLQIITARRRCMSQGVEANQPGFAGKAQTLAG